MKNTLLILTFFALTCNEDLSAQCTTTVTNDGSTGTQYYLPRYKNSTSACLQNSSIFDNGNVGIGTSSPGTNKLYVNGTLYGASTITAVGGFFNNSGQGVAHVAASNSFFGTSWSGITSATNATFTGVSAGGSVTSGAGNTLTGFAAGYYNSTGASNSIFGCESGYGVITNSNNNNSFFGYRSGYGISTGSYNVFLGSETGYSTTSGNNSILIGYHAGYLNGSGSNLICIGHLAGYNNTASYNSFIGYASGYQNTNAIYNTFVGYTTGYSATGGYNTAVGHQSGKSITTGTNNTSIGLNSIYYTTSGDYNTAVGVNAGATSGLNSNTIGDYNTYIGYGADANGNSYSNATAIGNGAMATGSNKVYIGNSSVSTTWVQVDWTIGSDRRIKNDVQENVPGLVFINMLRPVTFHYDIDKQNALLGIMNESRTDSTGQTSSPSNWSGKYDIEKIAFTGLIAQEVDSAAKKIGYNFSGVDASGPVMGLRYAEFTVPLIQAVQELSKTVDSLKTEIAQLQQAGTSNVNQITNGNETLILNNSDIILYQNEPNPFSSNTTIRFFIPENMRGVAQLVFFDIYGNQINKIDIAKKGAGMVNIAGDNLSSGAYTYSLVIDNNTVATKKMIKQ